jgi:hypothetical protein
VSGPKSGKPIDRDAIDKTRFYSKTRLFGECLLWTGAKNESGYGRFGQFYAHRVAYVLAYGEIPAGMTVDHVCRRRNCVRAEHLELVTQGANLLRSPNSISSRNLKKTACPKGHPYSTFERKDGRLHRRCDTCVKENNDARSDARRILGISQRQYLRQYGSRRSTAEAIIAAYRQETA